MPEVESNDKALDKAISWNNVSRIQNKYAVGTLTTAKYHEKVSVFDKVNAKAKDHSAILP